jgi:hypothetical protein
LALGHPCTHSYPRQLAKPEIEIYFSVVQRKVLTPNDFDSLSNLEAALLAFQERYEKSARPFQWTFTREKFAKLMIRLGVKPLAHAA